MFFVKNITISSLVTSIENFAFYSCSELETIAIGEGVEIISDYTFYYYYPLRNTIVSSSFTSNGDSTFYSCSELEAVAIGECMTIIGEYAFYGYSSLKSITNHVSVISICGYALSFMF